MSRRLSIQHLLGQGLRTGNQFAGDPAAQSALAEAMLRAMEGAREQIVEELAVNAAVARDLAIPVGGAFPDAQRGEMRRLMLRHVPLVHGVIGDAIHPHLAAAPRLRRGPLDTGIDVGGLARRPRVEKSGRAAGAARVDAQADIAVRHPFFRIDQLPHLIFVAGAFGDLGKRLDHALPGALVALLEGHPLAEGAIGHDHRILPVVVGPEHVGAQHDAVIHRDRCVPIDPHPVAHFAFGWFELFVHGRQPR